MTYSTYKLTERPAMCLISLKQSRYISTELCLRAMPDAGRRCNGVLEPMIVLSGKVRLSAEVYCPTATREELLNQGKLRKAIAQRVQSLFSELIRGPNLD